MEKAVRTAPENREFSNNLGQLKKNDGKVDEAIKAYRAALKADPDFADAHNNLAGAFEHTNRPEDAEAHYRQAITPRWVIRGHAPQRLRRAGTFRVKPNDTSIRSEFIEAQYFARNALMQWTVS